MYKYYYTTIKYMTEEQFPSGKVKARFKKDSYIVNATSITHAQSILKTILVTVYDNFQIISIKESDISGVINDIENVLNK